MSLFPDPADGGAGLGSLSAFQLASQPYSPDGKRLWAVGPGRWRPWYHIQLSRYAVSQRALRRPDACPHAARTAGCHQWGDQVGTFKSDNMEIFFVIFDTMWPSVFIYHQLFCIHHCDGGVVTHLTCEDISQSTEVICISLKDRPIEDRLFNLFLVGETTNIRRNL